MSSKPPSKRSFVVALEFIALLLDFPYKEVATYLTEQHMSEKLESLNIIRVKRFSLCLIMRSQEQLADSSSRPEGKYFQFKLLYIRTTKSSTTIDLNRTSHHSWTNCWALVARRRQYVISHGNCWEISAAGSQRRHGNNSRTPTIQRFCLLVSQAESMGTEVFLTRCDDLICMRLWQLLRSFRTVATNSVLSIHRMKIHGNFPHDSRNETCLLLRWESSSHFEFVNWCIRVFLVPACWEEQQNVLLRNVKKNLLIQTAVWPWQAKQNVNLDIQLKWIVRILRQNQRNKHSVHNSLLNRQLFCSTFILFVLVKTPNWSLQQKFNIKIVSGKGSG